MAAVAAQLENSTHTAFQVAADEPDVALAERLNALAPFRGAAKTVLFTTGAEAVENAVKIARAATGRPGVIAFAVAFHGRTLLTSALTGKVAPYKHGFGPLAAEVYHLPFPVAQQGVSVHDSLRALEFLFRADIEPARRRHHHRAGAGRRRLLSGPARTVQALRALCDRHGIVLTVDEAQTGFARSGRMFAIEHSGVEPDLATIAKSLGGGFPISGVIGRAALMDVAEPGALGGTYGGNPVACAAALAVLDVIAEEKLLERATAIGTAIKQRVQQWTARPDLLPIGDVRGPGAMVGFDLFTERGGTAPDAAAAKRVTARALEEGLILLSCGNLGNAIRILVPLTVQDAVLQEGLGRLEKALAA